jgi:hypothetical protein
LVLTLMAVVFFGLDMCAVAAFVVGLQHHNLPHAMAVGYGLTTLSGLIALPPTAVGVISFTTAVFQKCAGNIWPRDKVKTCMDNFCFCCCQGCDKNACCSPENSDIGAWDDEKSFIYTRHHWRYRNTSKPHNEDHLPSRSAPNDDDVPEKRFTGVGTVGNKAAATICIEHHYSYPHHKYIALVCPQLRRHVRRHVLQHRAPQTLSGRW